MYGSLPPLHDAFIVVLLSVSMCLYFLSLVSLQFPVKSFDASWPRNTQEIYFPWILAHRGRGRERERWVWQTSVIISPFKNQRSHVMVLMVCVGLSDPMWWNTTRYEPRESWDWSVDYLLLVFYLRCGVCVQHLILSEKGAGPTTNNIVLGNVAGYFKSWVFFFLNLECYWENVKENKLNLNNPYQTAINSFGLNSLESSCNTFFFFFFSKLW